MTKQVLRKAQRAVESKSGKALLRKRGEHLERSFAHMLDHGGLRRATLRGKENLTKRQIAAAMVYDLSLLMRKVFGYGTPKQWLAQGLFAASFWLLTLMRRRRQLFRSQMLFQSGFGRVRQSFPVVPQLAIPTR